LHLVSFFSTPRLPDAIIGHREQIAQISSDLESGNVAHAYLFSGPDHVGKMTVAFWLTRKLLVQDLDKEAAARSEHMIERLTHPDLLVLDQLWMADTCEEWDVIAQSSNIPQLHRSKAGAKTDTISVDDIRALHERLYETGLGTFRCCIVRGADRMQPNASNAFLKILEEPPQGLVFILTTSFLGSLLPTIVSRTRVIGFRRLPENELVELLEGVPADDQRFILLLAQGAPGIVRTLARDPDALRAHRLLQGKANAFWQASSLLERLQNLEPLLKRGEESDRMLLHLAIALRQKHTRTLATTNALLELVRGFETNAHRTLLVQRFALSVAGKEVAGPLLSPENAVRISPR
jgi:DNA polymerase III subunit delta'